MEKKTKFVSLLLIYEDSTSESNKEVVKKEKV